MNGEADPVFAGASVRWKKSWESYGFLAPEKFTPFLSVGSVTREVRNPYSGKKSCRKRKVVTKLLLQVLFFGEEGMVSLALSCLRLYSSISTATSPYLMLFLQLACLVESRSEIF